MKRYLLIGLATLGFAGSASAQGPEDVEAILNNLQPALEDLAAGLESTATTLADTQSAIETSEALGDTVVTTGSTLVQDTEFATLSLALGVNNDAVQGLLEPYLTVIDDPSAESLQGAFDPDDLSTIAANLEDVPKAALEGSGFGENGNGLRAAAIETLRGNLGDLNNPGALIYGAGGVIIPTQTLVEGTSFQQEVGNLAAINGLVIIIGGEPVWEQLRGPASDLGEAGAPLTEPVIDVLAGL